jgi:hypothetical protein
MKLVAKKQQSMTVEPTHNVSGTLLDNMIHQLMLLILVPSEKAINPLKEKFALINTSMLSVTDIHNVSGIKLNLEMELLYQSSWMSVLMLQASTINHKLLRSAKLSAISLPVLLQEDASIMIAPTLLPTPLLVKFPLLLLSAHTTLSADNSMVQKFQECASNLTHQKFQSAMSQTDVLTKNTPMAINT